MEEKRQHSSFSETAQVILTVCHKTVVFIKFYRKAAAQIAAGNNLPSIITIFDTLLQSIPTECEALSLLECIVFNMEP